MKLNPDFKEFIKLLGYHDAEYLVVGGYAVAACGYSRYTGDIDIWISTSEQNSFKIFDVLKDFGFSTSGLKPEDFQEENVVVQLGYEPYRIDILTSCTGLEFGECYKTRVESTIDDVKINLLDLKSLRKNKLALSRHKDLDDLENLPEL